MKNIRENSQVPNVYITLFLKLSGQDSELLALIYKEQTAITINLITKFIIDCLSE